MHRCAAVLVCVVLLLVSGCGGGGGSGVVPPPGGGTDVPPVEFQNLDHTGTEGRPEDAYPDVGAYER